MRFLADENCDRALVADLRRDGHDVLYALEYERGAADIALFRLAHKQSRILITDDLDFGHITKAESQHPPVVVLVRLGGLRRKAILDRVLSVVRALEEPLPNGIVLIEPGRVRFRAFENL